MGQLFSIAIGGAIGALLRFGLATAVQRGIFPWGTLAVNLLGCFLIGLLYQLFEVLPLPENGRLFIFTGLLGALTTFSTYGLDSVKLLRNGATGLGLLNIVASNALGILFVFGGIWLARLLLPTA